MRRRLGFSRSCRSARTLFSTYKTADAEYAAADVARHCAACGAPAGLPCFARLRTATGAISELLYAVTQHGTPVIIADNDSPHSSALEAGLVLPRGVATDADTAKRKAGASKKSKSAPDEVVSSILVSGADRKAYLMIDGVMTFETPINVHDPAKPLGTELFSLIGPSADGHFLQWTAFGLGGNPDAGVSADIWSNSVLARIDYLDAAAITRIEKTLRPGRRW